MADGDSRVVCSVPTPTAPGSSVSPHLPPWSTLYPIKTFGLRGAITQIIPTSITLLHHVYFRIHHRSLLLFLRCRQRFAPSIPREVGYCFIHPSLYCVQPRSFLGAVVLSPPTELPRRRPTLSASKYRIGFPPPGMSPFPLRVRGHSLRPLREPGADALNPRSPRHLQE